MSSYCIYDWGGTRAYYRFITFALLLIISVTDYIYMLIPNRILAWFACLLILECAFIPLVTWIDSIVGSCVIFILLYCMQKIYPEGLGEGYKITFVTWIYSGTERDFYRFIFSILL